MTRIVADRRWFRSGGESHRAGPAAAFTVLARALVAAAIALFAASHLLPGPIERLRAAVLSPLSPVLQAAASGAETVRTYFEQASPASRSSDQKPATPSQNDSRIPSELGARLETLERENRLLRALVPLAGRTQSVVLAARVIGGNATPLANVLVVAAGVNQGVKPGYPVVAGDRLIGKVHAVSMSTSLVVRLSDRRSRIPVLVGPEETRAILAGSGAGTGVLEQLGRGPRPRPGDSVMTSGVGGGIPRGMLVGAMRESSESLSVELETEERYDAIVGIVFVDEMIRDLPSSKQTESASPGDARKPPQRQARTGDGVLKPEGAETGPGGAQVRR